MLPALVVILSLFSSSHALGTTAKLDTAAVHRFYLEGDFDHAIDLLETALKYDMVTSHEDSVFAYKHLGVMYTAKYETREIGKKFMYQLLMIEPTARLMDMYASDMIYMIFKNIQEEVELSRPRPNKKIITSGSDSTAPVKEIQPTKRSLWPYWTAGVVLAGTGIGITTYFLLDRNPEPGTDYVVDD